MSPDLTAELAQFAADVQARAANLTDRINTCVPDGHITHAYVSNLAFAADLVADTARRIGRDGMYRRLNDEPVTADLDTADPDSARVDELLAEYANA
jgi:hypothetical protein